ncbi:protein scarlet-like isoform X2 [Cephus cinctus]|uniref:Protein scarlet-like isoform X2 n=1 Tax=Cephus cinctus TaxID=211228 RepID=A0AAJ7RAH6_CEPCN|nr:protein scarlet-like isoform X2 [Cephus cinctus]
MESCNITAEESFCRMSLESHADSPPDCQNNNIHIVWDDMMVRVEKQKKVNLSKQIYRKLLGKSLDADNGSVDILHGVSGYAKDGDMIAVMGPSGAGKTTFIAALAKKCAMKLDQSMTRSEKEVLMLKIISELGLYECRDTLTSSLSGGERKRLCLASEMVTNPKILFLDEPTTGLDMSTAMRVIEYIKRLVRNDTIVFCTIHQPATCIYKIFNNVIFLVNGTTAYAGTLSNATAFFESEGFVCPSNFDEAEYYVRVLSNQLSDGYEICRLGASNGATRLCTAFSKSPLSRVPETARRQILFEIRTHQRPNWLTQFYWLMWRFYLEAKRSIDHNIFYYHTYIFSVIMIGLIYHEINSREQIGIQNTRGALYITSAQIIFSSSYAVIYEIPKRTPLYLRESSMYGSAVYYVTFILGMIPSNVIKVLIFTSMLLLTLEINNLTWTFLSLSISLSSTVICSIAFGIMISSWLTNPSMGPIIMAPIDFIAMSMSGLFYNLGSLPWYIGFLKYLSIFYYTLDALSIIHWSHIDYIACYPDKNLPCLNNGTAVLIEYGQGGKSLYSDILGMYLLGLFMFVIGYFGVRYQKANKSIY